MDGDARGDSVRGAARDWLTGAAHQARKRASRRASEPGREEVQQRTSLSLRLTFSPSCARNGAFVETASSFGTSKGCVIACRKALPLRRSISRRTMRSSSA